MRTVPRRAASTWTLLQLVALVPAIATCGGDTAVGPVEDLAFLVGIWDATRFVVQSMENPEVAPDLIGDLGAEFFMNVEPSGSYSATLNYQQNPIVEYGRIEVDGDEIVFHVNNPPPTTSRSRYIYSPGYLTLVGDTEFAFIPGDEAKPAVATIDLKKR